MVRAVIGMVGAFGWGRKETADIAERGNEEEVERASQEYHAAHRALAQARANFETAEPAFVGQAIDELNIATYRSDAATRKLRILLGIAPPSEEAHAGVKELATR